MTDDIAMLTAEALLAAYRAGEISPVDATKAALARIERFNGKVNAFNLVDAEGALAAASESAEALASWGAARPSGRLPGVDQGSPPHRRLADAARIQGH